MNNMEREKLIVFTKSDLKDQRTVIENVDIDSIKIIYYLHKQFTDKITNADLILYVGESKDEIKILKSRYTNVGMFKMNF